MFFVNNLFYLFRSPTAYITHPITQLATKPAPFMAAFSSQGPNQITPEILKVCSLFYCVNFPKVTSFSPCTLETLSLLPIPEMVASVKGCRLAQEEKVHDFIWSAPLAPNY